MTAGTGASRAPRAAARTATGPILNRAALVAFDHRLAFGNAEDCRRCHGAWRFTGAYLPGHDACFPIRTGTHSGIRCLKCHTSYPSLPWDGSCNPNDPTLNCIGCHSGCPEGHSCPITSQRCYQCHPTGSGGGG